MGFRDVNNSHFFFGKRVHGPKNEYYKAIINPDGTVELEDVTEGVEVKIIEVFRIFCN